MDLGLQVGMDLGLQVGEWYGYVYLAGRGIREGNERAAIQSEIRGILH